MRRTTRLLPACLLATVCAVSPALAHLVPIPVSTCVFDPVALSVPAMGLVGSAPAAPADAMRIAFDAPANQIQMCPASGGTPELCGGTSVARPFTLGAIAGTLTFPAVFSGSMLSSGDVTIPDLPITVAIGVDAARVPVTLTAALTAVNGTVVEGVPLSGLGTLTVVGVLDGAALPPPLTGRSVLLTVSCLPRPVPDKDQFAPPIQFASLRGVITADGARLRATADVPLASSLDLTQGPTLLAVDLGGTTIASAVISGGLRGTRMLTGESDDGHTTVTVRSTRRGATSHLVMTIRSRQVTLPPQTARAPVLIDLTLDAGGAIGRGEQLFHVSADARRLRGG